MENNSLKGLNEEYAALIKEYLEKVKNRVTGVLLFGSLRAVRSCLFHKAILT